jgi:hypothetical protein
MASSDAAPTPLPRNGSKGGGRRGHLWIARASLAFRCEGLDPFREEPVFATGHRDIAITQPYLRKIWEAAPDSKLGRGCEISSRHCVACGKAIEVGF